MGFSTFTVEIIVETQVKEKKASGHF